MRAIDSAQPRPRAQAASSAPTASRKTPRMAAVSRFHAGIRSHAGSPSPPWPSRARRSGGLCAQEVARHQVRGGPTSAGRSSGGAQRLGPDGEGRGRVELGSSVRLSSSSPAGGPVDRTQRPSTVGRRDRPPAGARRADELRQFARGGDGSRPSLGRFAVEPAVAPPTSTGYPSAGSPVATTAGTATGRPVEARRGPVAFLGEVTRAAAGQRGSRTVRPSPRRYSGVDRAAGGSGE